MCDKCDWATYLEIADQTLDKLDDLPERAEEFADGVRERLESMADYMRDKAHVSPGMATAIDNMAGAVDNWLK